MTSMPRVGLAVLFMFALQGCEDKGTCQKAQTKDKKDVEACCKDGKPGEGPRLSSLLCGHLRRMYAGGGLFRLFRLWLAGHRRRMAN